MKKVSLNTHSKCPDFRRKKKTTTQNGNKAIGFTFGSEDSKAGKKKKAKIFQDRLLNLSVQKAFSDGNQKIIW